MGELKVAVKHTELVKAAMRSRVEHPFRVVKRQFGCQKVRFKGMLKNTARVLTLFALSILWIVRRRTWLLQEGYIGNLARGLAQGRITRKRVPSPLSNGSFYAFLSRQSERTYGRPFNTSRIGASPGEAKDFVAHGIDDACFCAASICGNDFWLMKAALPATIIEA